MILLISGYLFFTDLPLNFPIKEKKIINHLHYGFRSVGINNQSYFSNIYELEKGTNFTINIDNKIKKKRYRNIKKNKTL